MIRHRLWSVLGPGILVAATGVGAGDLATGALTGSVLGMTVLWAVLLGAFFKFILNEGLTRWQLATGSTLLEGAMKHLGRPAQIVFLPYFVLWSFMVAAALMSACGVTAQAIYPISEDPSTGKTIYGILLSLAGLGLVRWGGFRLFEKVMGICIGLMFITVLVTAFLLMPRWDQLISGLLLPRIPQLDEGGVGWTVALIGGVGGTVTVLCYGYWIQEEGRFGPEHLKVCRLDLAAGYLMTAMFGLAMVVIGSTIQIEGSGASLVVRLADRLVEQLGWGSRWIFLVGAFGAVFSSLLGVWQSVPYLFADLWQILGGPLRAGSEGRTRSLPYRWYLTGMAVIPMIGLWVGFARMQKTYAILGALFVPMLALVLLIMNGRTAWVGERHRNHPAISGILILILMFFLGVGWLTIR